MRKTLTTNSKKVKPVKDQQKISSFFNKLTCKKTLRSTHLKNDLKDELQSTSTTNGNTEITSDDEDCLNVVTNSNAKFNPIKKNASKLGVKKLPVKSRNNERIAKKDNNFEDSPHNSDNDFIDSKKQKALHSFKSSQKNIYLKTPKKEKHNQDCTRSSKINIENNDESLLIIDLDSDFKNKTINPKNENIFEITPEKTFLEQDDIDLVESNLNLKSIDSIFIEKEFKNGSRKSSPPHSTPRERIKKRKYVLRESPDIIPPTPQEYKPIKSRKSKLSFIKKNPTIQEQNSDTDIPDMVVKSPPQKKTRPLSLDKNKTIINLSNDFDKLHALSVEKTRSLNSSKENSKTQMKSPLKDIDFKENQVGEISIENIQLTPTKPDNVLHSTSKFNITPIKNLSPSTKSPYKGDITKFEITPTKSKRILFENQLEFSKTTNVCKKETNMCENDLVDGFKCLTSSNEDQKCMELDESNFIITKQPPKLINCKSKQQKDTEEHLEGLIFDDIWDEEIINIEEKDELKLDNWTYCRVLEITKDIYQNQILKLQSIKTNIETICSLQGVWQHVRLQPGDLINISAVKSSDSTVYCVNNNEGFLVFEPDIMVSPTSIVGSQFCKRRGILQEKFRGFDPENKIMIVGTLVHKLLEEVLKKKIYTNSLIEKKIIEILNSRDMMDTSYSSQISIEDIKKEVFPFIPKIVHFIENYILADKRKVKTNFRYDKNSEEWKGIIYSIRDIEENIWCPQLGIKGKVDVTVNIDELNNKIVPVELKTGRATMSLEHRGQIIMYVMMMNELGYNVASGLLLYLRESKLRELTTCHREKRDLLMMRNEFAYYIKQKPQLPANANIDNQSVSSKSSVTVMSEIDPMRPLTMAELPEPINHHSACMKCPYALICTAFLKREKTYELSKSHPLAALSDDILSHLEPTHIDYFVHWTSLITLENHYKPPVKQLKDIWRLEPYQRELRSKSISYLEISGNVNEDNDYYIHTFKRTRLVSGNYVVISTNTRVAVATGFIRSISENEVIIGLERNLMERYNNQLFHIDTYESVQILNFSMTSMAALLESTERAAHLRQSIINKKLSVIPPKCTAETSRIIKTAKAQVIIKRLNKIQQRAVLSAMIIKDYLLIKGMPGTGKTATIVALIQLLVLLNKSVLITSHTHSAVDNVCLRLLGSGVDFLRLGSENRIHPQLKQRSESFLTAHCKTVEEITEVYNKVKVVAVTCLAAGHPLFSHRKLDVCIVDESTQVLQSSVIKALLSTTTFILIGDPDQLPPVVRNPEAVRRGMSESLFERLDNPKSTITLTLQYRMNKTITELANAVTYRGQLLCADDSIGYAILRLPKLQRFQSIYSQEQWIISALDTQIENAVIAIDTGPTWNKQIDEKQNDDDLLSELQLAPQNVKEDEERKCSNNFETAVVISIIEALKQAEVLSSTIGVIAPYRAQVELLKKKVANIYCTDNCESVEVNTVDQYQGRDKDVIIYSCTRSRDTTKVKNNTGFEILNDKRRLTVAITRAKHKLIIIGDFLTLKHYSPFNTLINSLQNKQILVLNNIDWKKIMKRVEDE